MPDGFPGSLFLFADETELKKLAEKIAEKLAQFQRKTKESSICNINLFIFEFNMEYIKCNICFVYNKIK